MSLVWSASPENRIDATMKAPDSISEVWELMLNSEKSYWKLAKFKIVGSMVSFSDEAMSWMEHNCSRYVQKSSDEEWTPISENVEERNTENESDGFVKLKSPKVESGSDFTSSDSMSLSSSHSISNDDGDDDVIVFREPRETRLEKPESWFGWLLYSLGDYFFGEWCNSRYFLGKLALETFLNSKICHFQSKSSALMLTLSSLIKQNDDIKANVKKIKESAVECCFCYGNVERTQEYLDLYDIFFELLTKSRELETTAETLMTFSDVMLREAKELRSELNEIGDWYSIHNIDQRVCKFWNDDPSQVLFESDTKIIDVALKELIREDLACYSKLDFISADSKRCEKKSLFYVQRGLSFSKTIEATIKTYFHVTGNREAYQRLNRWWLEQNREDETFFSFSEKGEEEDLVDLK